MRPTRVQSIIGADDIQVAARDYDVDVTFAERTYEAEKRISAVAESLSGIQGYLAIGMLDQEGRYLLKNDGSHGWALPSVAVTDGEDWDEAADDFITSLGCNEESEIAVKRIRRKEFYRQQRQKFFELHEVVVSVRVKQKSVVSDANTDDNVRLDWHDSMPEPNGEEYENISDDLKLFI